MGQTVIGLLLGCDIPKGVELYDDEAEDGGLLERYERALTKALAGRRGVTPEWVGDSTLVGFWVLCEHGDEKDCGDIPTGGIPLAGIERTRTYKTALSRWKRWAKWAEKHGVKFPEPALYLAETEVA